MSVKSFPYFSRASSKRLASEADHSSISSLQSTGPPCGTRAEMALATSYTLLCSVSMAWNCEGREAGSPGPCTGTHPQPRWRTHPGHIWKATGLGPWGGCGERAVGRRGQPGAPELLLGDLLPEMGREKGAGWPQDVQVSLNLCEDGAATPGHREPCPGWGRAQGVDLSKRAGPCSAGTCLPG